MNCILRDLCQKISMLLNRQNVTFSSYTLLSLLASAFVFYRSILVSSKLNLTQLGDLSLILSNVAILSLVHFGFLSGSLRELSKDEEEIRFKVKELKNFLVLVLLLSISIYFLVFKWWNNVWPNRMIVFSVLLILANLNMSWKTNELIALKRHQLLGIASVVSSAMSCIYILNTSNPSLQTIILGLLVQPIVFVLISWRSDIVFRIKFHKSLFKGIMNLGISLFLTTALFTISLNLEKMSVARVLGNTALGSLFLYYLFMVVVFLFPNTVGNFFYADLVRAYEKHDLATIRSIKTRIFVYYGIYFAVLCFCVFLLAPGLIRIFLPEHVAFINTLYYALPVVLLKLFAEAIYLFLSAKNASKQIRKIEIITFICHVMLLCIFYFSNVFREINMIIFFAGIYSVVRLSLLLMYEAKFVRINNF